ncbi:hypothetical protein ACOI1H_13570 [Loktanella sp. DJP18]|uniref:hypothetical protein n=1 Tax=Loktanella sp. DJP18 TaxID=3409788 RepID=UPI003BB566A2
MSVAHALEATCDDSREACMAKALSLGFTKVNLWNLDSTIARTAQTILKAANRKPGLTGLIAAQDLPAVMRVVRATDFGFDELSRELSVAVLALPQVARACGTDELVRLGKLVQIFADFTRSTPQGIDKVSWRAGLALCGAAIEEEARLMALDPDHDAAVMREALSFLIANMSDLWD